jgi:hypothetical protein
MNLPDIFVKLGQALGCGTVGVITPTVPLARLANWGEMKDKNQNWNHPESDQIVTSG